MLVLGHCMPFWAGAQTFAKKGGFYVEMIIFSPASRTVVMTCLYGLILLKIKI